MSWLWVLLPLGTYLFYRWPYVLWLGPITSNDVWSEDGWGQYHLEVWWKALRNGWKPWRKDGGRPQIRQYRVTVRQQEKQASRDQDERDLASGAKTPEQLNRENGLFSRVKLRPNLKAGRKLS